MSSRFGRLPSPAARLLSCWCVLLISAIVGCAAPPGTSTRGEPSATLTPEDFVASPDEALAEPAPEDGSVTETDKVAPRLALQPAPQAESPPQAVPLDDVIATVGDPPVGDHAAPLTSSRRVVDALVGQINGRPIYASEVLAPLDARLRSDGRLVAEGEMTISQFKRDAGQSIIRRLQDLIRNEVFLTEAETSIDDEQRQALLGWLKQQIRARRISLSGGSVEAAQRDVLAEYEMSLDQYVDETANAELIRRELDEEVFGRIRVTWREIERAYYEQQERFNPPRSVRVRLLTMLNDEEERAAVGEALARGESLGEIIESDEISLLYLRRDAGLVTGPLDFELAELTCFDEAEGLGPFNEALRTLAEGEVSSPIEFLSGAAVGWVCIEEVVDPAPVSLYDAQQLLREEILREKILREQNRFIGELTPRTSHTDLGVMARLLLELAQQRHLDL
ncbi:MAG: hypothetical protein KAS72_15135 [Phycisphaerales bacterium]|nr:hypothetical protein [Phycisphaerales bacterium]